MTRICLLALAFFAAAAWAQDASPPFASDRLVVRFAEPLQATPLVAGAASLLRALNPGLDPEAIRTILRETAADEVGRPNEDTPGFDVYHGYGRLDLYAALAAVPLVAAPDRTEEALGLSVFPNPSRGRVSIAFTLDRPQPVRVEVCDGQGRAVAALHEGRLVAGPQRLGWDGVGQPAGVYLVRVSGASFTESHVLTRVR